MADHTRRHLLRTAAITAAGAPFVGPDVARADVEETDRASSFGPVTVGPDDSRYADLVRRGNRRFEGQPDQVRIVGSTRQVVDAVNDAVRAGHRLAVRSGGHCFENFVDDPAVRVIIDLSGLTSVSFDHGRNAFAIEAGAPLGEVYRRLFLGWGVTVPAGYCPTVGAGGHLLGGGYGPLCRMFGLASDHLYAVEVVVVGRNGKARAVVATRETNDPHRDLWWAHTGGGGGNFGVVTRYWLRTPGARGTDPTRLLPKPPATVLTFTAEWSWDGMDERALARIVRNHGRWCENNSADGIATARLYSELLLFRRQYGKHLLMGQVAGGANAEHLLAEHVDALSHGVGSRPVLTSERLPWLESASKGSGEDGKSYRLKCKAAYLRRALNDRQARVIYEHLTRDVDVLGGSLSLNTYGGRVNTMASGATATAQRDSIAKLFFLVAWGNDPKEDARHLRWIREFYRDLYADTGGVPVPGAVNDGSFINYPDVDLADPAWNTSDVPWHALYYKGNYARLQAVKAQWDPRNVFRHRLSITPS